jgi:hypothetical protein
MRSIRCQFVVHITLGLVQIKEWSLLYSGLPTQTEKNPLKTPDFRQKIPCKFPPKNPLKFPKNTYNSPKMRQILRNECVYLVINSLKNRAEHVLGC